MKDRLLKLYEVLLRIYPPRFRLEFGEEMRSVFVQALESVDSTRIGAWNGRLLMVRLFWKEVRYLPGALSAARRYQSEAELPAMIGSQADSDRAVQGLPDESSGWAGVLAGMLPFLLFGSAYLVQAARELGWLASWPAGLIRNAPLFAYGIISFGLALGWVSGFPRWSLAYLGVGLYWGNYYSHGRFYGVTYGYQGWLPLLAGLVVGLLLSRSFRSVLRLIGSIWRDWTLLSFGMYAYVLPVMTVIFFDSDWGKLEFYGLIFDTLLVAAGAAVYLRSQTIWIKAVSLQGVMILMAIRGFFMGGWFGGAENLASINLFALLTIPLFWGGLLFIPGLLGLLRRGLGLLNTQGRT